MKTGMKSMLLIPVPLAVGVSAAGTAVARRGDGGHDPRDDRAERGGSVKGPSAERMSTHLDALAERLALRPDQHPAWRVFRESSESLRPHPQARGAHARYARPPRRCTPCWTRISAGSWMNSVGVRTDKLAYDRQPQPPPS
jgi:hypothetical protein